jgi:hypothetical protein
MYCLFSLQSEQISQQPEKRENRNDPDFVQAFVKKWWVESDFKAPNSTLSTLTVFITILEQNR